MSNTTTHTYWHLTWQWENTDGTRGHGNDHLLKDETDYNSNATTLKQNLISIDMERIKDHTPYASKKVKMSLASFDDRIDIGKKGIFIKINYTVQM